MVLASDRDIEDFVEEVEEVFGERLDRVILYGSYARDEHVPGSDVDIAILVKEKRKGDRQKAFDLAYRYQVERDLFFSPQVFKTDEFEEKLREGYSFYSEVENQGVEI